MAGPWLIRYLDRLSAGVNTFFVTLNSFPFVRKKSNSCLSLLACPPARVCCARVCFALRCVVLRCATKRWFNKLNTGQYSLFWQAHCRNTYFSEDAKDLINKILTVDPAKRITTQGIKNHPWLQVSE